MSNTTNHSGWKTITCPICKSPKFKNVVHKDKHDNPLSVVICLVCSFVYLNPRPDAEWCKKFYRHEYRKPESSKYDPQKGYLANSPQMKRFQWFSEILKEYLLGEHIQNPHILDIGCGSGALLHAVQAQIPEAILFGIEPDPTFAAYATQQTKSTIVNTDIDSFAEVETKIGLTQIDIVLMSHVLEHLNDPIATLQRIRKFQKPNGIILIQVPHPFPSILIPIKKMFHVAHVSYFDRLNLDQVLTLAGYHQIQEHHESPKTLTITARVNGNASSNATVSLSASNSIITGKIRTLQHRMKIQPKKATSLGLIRRLIKVLKRC